MLYTIEYPQHLITDTIVAMILFYDIVNGAHISIQQIVESS